MGEKLDSACNSEVRNARIKKRIDNVISRQPRAACRSKRKCKVRSWGFSWLATCLVNGALAVGQLGLHTSEVKAAVIVDQKPIGDAIGRAELIVKAQIESIKQHWYSKDGARRLCGTTYSVEVITTYKGAPSKRLSFSVYQTPLRILFHDLNVGDELLLLLANAASDRSDPMALALPDVLGLTSKERSRCLARLERLRISEAGEGAFALVDRKELDGSKTRWLAFARVYTRLPTIAGLHERPYSDSLARVTHAAW